jgi:predicted aspartyl protease
MTVHRSFCSLGLLAALTFLCVPTRAEPSPVPAGIEARDILKLEALSGTAASEDERRLANGAALSLRHKDEAALAVLEPLSQSAADKEIRAAACLALADVYLRRSRFADTHAALQCAQDVSGKPLTGEALQALATTAILAGEQPMRLARPAAGRLDAKRDAAGLVRVPVEINGKAQDAVIDTDSSFSVLSESAAARLGVRVLEKGATILTSTRPDLPMHLGVADTLKFGEAVFSNVVFAVLPDAALRFAHGYKMDPVVGLPVFVALDRIELAREDGHESLYYGARPGAAAATEANLILSSLDPFALVKAGKTGALLRLAIDSAASDTTLNATALKDFPALGEGASHGWAHWEGGGGAVTDYGALTLYELPLSVAGRTMVLKRIQILSAEERDRHGMIGQDLLRKAKRWVLDFTAMSFTIGD